MLQVYEGDEYINILKDSFVNIVKLSYLSLHSCNTLVMRDQDSYS